MSAPAGNDLSAAEIARAARILALRTRREVSGSFAGCYASAFRGGGLEFDESRPYVPGDDVRTLDWNALARSGEPFVKRFREERDQLLLLALDVSASMRFGAAGESKSVVAAHTTALLAAAAGHAGDRVGLIAFDQRVRERIDSARGPAHTWRVIRSAVASAQASEGETKLAAAIEGMLEAARRRAVVVLLSDFRDPMLADAFGTGDAATPATLDESTRALRASLVALGRRHDLVSVAFFDPREEELPRVGLVRVADPERSNATLVVQSNSARTRARYRDAWALRRQRLDRGMRAIGGDVLWLRTDRDPLRRLMLYFAQRAAGARGVR